MIVKDIVAAYEAGQTSYAIWRKNPVQTTASGIWFDLSMSSGTPTPNYYIGAITTATPLTKTDNGGLNHGPSVSPSTKYLSKFLAMTQTTTAVPLTMILADYLLFYPFIEQSDGTQTMTNSVTLPRYTDGAGVMMMAVLQNADVGGTSFNVTYTNSAGVAGRTSATVVCNTQVAPGTIKNSNSTGATALGPFIPLRAGDTGVRSIEAVNYTGSDIGLFALVLVKPLITHQIYDITAPNEADMIIDRNSIPVIKDDAFLGTIVLPTGTLSGSAIIGEITTFWG